MRYVCYFCGTSVTTDLPNEAIIRAILVCPECIEKKRIKIPASKPLTVPPGDPVERRDG